jgi:hypothetical protein
VDEWTWNATYAQTARHWALEHMGAVMELTVRKLWVTLFEVRHTPTYGSATDKQLEGSPGIRAAMLVWMLIARLPFFVLLALIARDLRAGRNRAYLWAGLLLLAGCLPYILVFSYQRHVIPLLEMAAALLAVLYCSRPRDTGVSR